MDGLTRFLLDMALAAADKALTRAEDKVRDPALKSTLDTLHIALKGAIDALSKA